MAPLALPGYVYEWISCSPLEVAAKNITASQKFKGMLQNTKDGLQFRKSSCTRHHNHTRIIKCTFSAAEVISFGTSMGIAFAAAGGSDENLQVVKMPKAMSSEHLGAYMILGTTRFSGICWNNKLLQMCSCYLKIFRFRIIHCIKWLDQSMVLILLRKLTVFTFYSIWCKACYVKCMALVCFWDLQYMKQTANMFIELSSKSLVNAHSLTGNQIRGSQMFLSVTTKHQTGCWWSRQDSMDKFTKMHDRKIGTLNFSCAANCFRNVSTMLY